MQIGNKDPVPGSFLTTLGFIYLFELFKKTGPCFFLTISGFHHHVKQVMIQANKRYLPADNEFC